MTLAEYSQLKNSIIYAVGRSDRYDDILSSLKETFKKDINSIRRFEQIDTIGKLLNVLEIRDLLTEDNVACLRTIAQKLSNSKELLSKITDYEDFHTPRENETYYATVDNSKMGQESFITANNVPYRRNLSPKKQQRIFQTVIDDIGSHWRDLARNLGVKEGAIDNYDFEYKNVTEKATKIIKDFQASADLDPDRWFFELTKALEKTRRKDIVRSLHKVMAMNI